ncbi:Ribose ABC transport system, periplasmic ribose-binding protein RbsB (TC 3.A.1.2.1) [Gulosibacter sp. 10]|nr:Ribose ABC transport system, periplasmic ribose-binding protein RbsB (TC 3.A.1.2.1) [Gulosibacter sp. 10]
MAAGLLALTGCSGETGGGGGGDGDQLVIPVVLKTTTAPYWQVVQRGVEDAAEEFGTSTTVGGASAETAVQEQIDRIQADLLHDPDVLVVAPTQAEQLQPVLQSAVDSGVPVVLLDTDIEGWDGAETFIGTNNYELGQQAGEWILEEAGEGEVLTIRGVPGNPSTDDRIDGAIEAWEGSGLEVVSDLPANSDRAEGRSVTADALQANPEISVIFAANDDMALGAIEAIKGAGLDVDDFLIVGVNGDSDAIDSIEAGELDATMAQGAREMGYQAIEVATQIAAGETFDREISVDATLVTDENAAEYRESLE